MHSKQAKIGISGAGNIGNALIRVLIERGLIHLLKHINDPFIDAEMLAGLIFYHEYYQTPTGHTVKSNGPNELIIDGHTITCSQEFDPDKVDWSDCVVAECSGVYVGSHATDDPCTCAGHIAGGARYVLVSAPTKGSIAVPVMNGVSDFSVVLDPAKQVYSGLSCTTTSISFPLSIVAEFAEVEWIDLTTIHAPTSTDSTVDRVGKNRKTKAATLNRGIMANAIFGATGAAGAVALAVPSLKGKLGGEAVRCSGMDTGSESVLKITFTEGIDMEGLQAALLEGCSANKFFGCMPAIGGVKPTLKQVRKFPFGGAYVPHTFSHGGNDKHASFHTFYDNVFGYTTNFSHTLEALTHLGVKAA